MYVLMYVCTYVCLHLFVLCLIAYVFLFAYNVGVQLCMHVYMCVKYCATRV